MPADIAALFGSEPCRSALAAAQRTGLWLDALGFIPSYVAFLFLGAWAAGGRARRWTIAAFLVAGLGDEIEGVLLFAILHALPGSALLVGTLFWVVRLKFLLLALGTIAVAVPLLLTWRHVGTSLGFVMGLGGVMALIDFFELPAGHIMGDLAIGWAMLLASAAIGAVWPRLLAARPRAPAPPSA